MIISNKGICKEFDFYQIDYIKFKKKLKKDDVLMFEKIQNFFILGNLKEKMLIFDFFYKFVFFIKFYKKI